jgi:two-component system chemotaxis response regulator CheY
MAYQFHKISVLLIDSQPAMLKLITDVLTAFGVRDIHGFTNGASGLEAFRTHRPDLLIVDWDLESLDGIAFTRAIRQDPHMPYVPIIFMTALSSGKRVSEARDSGVTEFLRKPFTAESLYRRIEAIIEKPRVFVQSDGFTGPDRRRRTEGGFEGDDRREED